MRVPLILVVLSTSGSALAVWRDGLVLSDSVLFGLVVTLAALVLLLRNGLIDWLLRLARAPRWIVVDGSNVMHWDGNVPTLRVVTAVLQDLTARGFRPVVWFDANVGYKVSQRYMGPDALADVLRIPARQILVAPKGTPADPLLLAGAVDLGARVVTNDRLQDWVPQFPQIRQDGFLVRGGIVNGTPQLDLQGD
ncbi:MAG: hypothetical protein Q7J57_17355 [Gemmobacter sp.]|nr:hypothetical protein [Gemmobacter sp.]